MKLVSLFMGILSTSSSYLGIDIGATSIKIVELQKEAGIPRLLTYGFSEDVKFDQGDWQKNTKHTAKIIKKICKESGVVGNSAISALPTFSVFSSVLNLSNVGKNEIASAVHWEAKKVIPLPLEEMILDWKKIDDGGKNKDGMKVLLTGAPRTLVKNYIDIFKEAQINLLSLETETFSLIRSLLGNDKSTIMLLELGAGTTDVTIVDNGIPMFNRSIDVGGKSITKALSNFLNIGFDRAEQFKCDLGIDSMDVSDDKVLKVIVDAISPIVNEIKYAMNLFQSKNKKKTEKIVLSGGSALLPNITNYLSKVLDVNVIIGDPWSRISYHKDLGPLLNEIGPYMSVAVGLAMREIK